MSILVLKLSILNMATNFVSPCYCYGTCLCRLFSRQTAWRKCLLSEREKTRHSSALRKNNCPKHWNGRTRKFCAWISLSAVTKKDQHLIVPATFTFFYSEWYIHYHETGKSKACYRSGKRWCTSFRKNVNKTLATKTTYKKSGEKTLDILKGFHLLISNSFPSATNICFSRFQVYATTNPT